MSIEIVRFQNVIKSFNVKGKPPVKAVDNVSFTVNQGDIFGFIGLNGAGKTTAIKLMLGLCKLDSGTLELFNKPFVELNMRRIGFASEVAELPDHLTAREFLKYLCALSDVSVSGFEIQKCLIKVGLEEVGDKRISTFSKGMKQRLSLGAAIIHDPELVVLDEPSSGLDPIGRKLLRQLIIELHKNRKTVLFSTHILTDVKEICNKVALIHKGNLLFEGKIEDFCPKNDSIEGTFEKHILASQKVEIPST